MYAYGFLLAFFNLFFGVTFIDRFHPPDPVTTHVSTPDSGNKDVVNEKSFGLQMQTVLYAFVKMVQKLALFLTRSFILTWACLSPLFIPIIAFPLARVVCIVFLG